MRSTNLLALFNAVYPSKDRVDRDSSGLFEEFLNYIKYDTDLNDKSASNILLQSINIFHNKSRMFTYIIKTYIDQEERDQEYIAALKNLFNNKTLSLTIFEYIEILEHGKISDSTMIFIFELYFIYCSKENFSFKQTIQKIKQSAPLKFAFMNSNMEYVKYYL
jgi:hypothetical protein